MSGDKYLTPPSTIWAQKQKDIVLTILLEDCKKPEIQIDKEKVYFKGIGGTDKKSYEVTINLFKEISPEESSYKIQDRIIEIVLKKKEEGPFWPQLTKEKVKHHWLRFDFNKWHDEDTDDDEESPVVLDDAIKNMFIDEQKQFDKLDFKDMDDGADSDDSDLPDLE